VLRFNAISQVFAFLKALMIDEFVSSMGGIVSYG